VNYVIGQLQHVFGNSQVVVMTHITEKLIRIHRTVVSSLNSEFQQLAVQFSFQMCVLSLSTYLSNNTVVKAEILKPQSQEPHIFAFCLPWNQRPHNFLNYETYSESKYRFDIKKNRVRFRIKFYCYQILHSSNYFSTYSPPLLRHLS